MEKKYCLGCTNNFYNANNDLGVRECWSFKDAKPIMRKEVHINQAPPWNMKPEKYPDCYRKSQFVYVDCTKE